MNNGISGYNAGRINPYDRLDSLQPAAPRSNERSNVEAGRQGRSTENADLGPGLSKEEAGMIQKYFPSSEQMELKLYGPRSETRSINPNAVGQRLDLLG